MRFEKSIDAYYLYRRKIKKKIEEESMWFWEFMCGKLNICSQAATDTTPSYDAYDFDALSVINDTGITTNATNHTES